MLDLLLMGLEIDLVCSIQILTIEITVQRFNGVKLYHANLISEHFITKDLIIFFL